jgi:hypothetical protein
MGDKINFNEVGYYLTKISLRRYNVPPQPTSRCRVLAEILLIFAVFFLQGAWPAPDVNETHYLAKAIHYWNPDWVQGDLFMESPDTHTVFVVGFGWLSLWLSPVALVWTGRLLTWFLLAWSWWRLSFAVVPRPWFSVLTAALFACLTDRCQMAGEWVIGGVEAKGFAYVFVFLGLESLVRNRWNRGLLLFGAASAIHVLVGGWVAMATGIAWLWLKMIPKHQRSLTLNQPLAISQECTATTGRGFIYEPPPLRSLWPGILGGLLLSLPGLIPSLTLDWGVDHEIVRKAHEIYTFERLPHHLMLTGIRPEFILRLALLWIFWILLGHWGRRSNFSEDTQEYLSRLRAFVSGAVVIALIGVVLLPLCFLDRSLAGHLFRFYWFRTTDMALPLGVALEGVAWIACSLRNGGIRGIWLTLAILLAAFHVGDYALERLNPSPPRSHRIAGYNDWRSACTWVAAPGNVPPDARFLAPRLSQTFKWYTGHSDVVTWKDVPQDPEHIVEWWNRIQDIYTTGLPPPEPKWRASLAEIGEEGLRRLGAKYKADYVITEATDPPLNLNVVYQNDTYVIYRIE